jgi:hypothetical protein
VSLLDFRDVVAARGPVDVSLGTLSANERIWAAASWRARMVSEYVSSRVFATLSSQALAAGLSHRVVEELARMCGEEIDHARRCARVVAAFDETPVAPLPKLPPVPLHEDAAPLEALLRNVVSVSCCSETTAVALVGAEHALAGTEDLKKELERILADEVGHARIGWRMLDDAPIDDALRARLGAWLATCFAHQIDHHRGSLAMPAVSAAALAVGAPDGPANFELFVATMESVTVPGLEARGFAAERAWARALAERRAA